METILYFRIIIKTLQLVQDLTSHFKSSRTTSHTKWRFREGFSGDMTCVQYSTVQYSTVQCVGHYNYV